MEEILELLRSIADGAYVIDSQQRVIFWNASAEALLGYTAEEVMGRLCYEVFAGQDERGHSMCRRDCVPLIASVRGKSVPNFDIQVRTKAGESRWVNVSIIAVPRPGEGRHAVIHLFRDIDAKKRAEAFAAEVAARARQLQVQQPVSRHPAQDIATAGEGAGATLDNLTPRELEVLELLVAGADTEAIATELMVSKATVRNHVQHVLNKLGVHSRLEAVAYAREHHLI